MTVSAPNARCSGRETAGCFPKVFRNEQRISTAGEECGSDVAVEMLVFAPEFKRQSSGDTMENNLVTEFRSCVFRWYFQPVLCNEKVVSLFVSEHLQA